MNPSVPELETDRLILRPHVREDFDESYALWSDETVTRFIGGKPFSREEVWSRLLRYAGHWALLGYGYWVIREKNSGRFVGEIGFADYQRDIEPPLGAPEIGWALMPSMHGIGYATEDHRAGQRGVPAGCGEMRLRRGAAGDIQRASDRGVLPHCLRVFRAFPRVPISSGRIV